ncbi:MAG: YdbL family protein [Nevskiales bacterium]
MKTTTRSILATKFALISALLAGCVTINVYFPAVAAEKAADRIIEDVWGKQPQGEPAAPAPDTQGRQGSAVLSMLALRVLDFMVPVAAAAEPNIDISSPAVQQVKDSMESRHASLAPHYGSGAVGLTSDGMVAVRDANAVPLAERNNVKKLVADENADRSALYREIAVANSHPEWEGDIRKTFAERWVAKAQGGWYYQDGSGSWVQK